MRASLKSRPFCGGSKPRPAPTGAGQSESGSADRRLARRVVLEGAELVFRAGRVLSERARENLRSFPRGKFVSGAARASLLVLVQVFRNRVQEDDLLPQRAQKPQRLILTENSRRDQ